MKSLDQILELLSANLKSYKRRYKIKKMAIFGPYARGEQLPNAAVDIFVEFDKGIGLEFVDLQDELEDLLEMKVNLVTKSGMEPDFLKNVKKEMIVI